MITRFRLENFKGHRDTDLALQPFTLLVGDNGSGKTSVLEALRLPDTLAIGAQDLAFDELLHSGTHQLQLSFDGSTPGELWATSMVLRAPGYNDWGNTWQLEASGVDRSGEFKETAMPGIGGEYKNVLSRITRHIGNAGLYRFRADQVAASAYSDHPDASVAEDGAQTAVALAALTGTSARGGR
jgi:hypothetical protein